MASPFGTKTPYGSVVPPALSAQCMHALRSDTPLSVGLRATYTPHAFAHGFSRRLWSELRQSSAYWGSQSVAPAPCLRLLLTLSVFASVLKLGCKAHPPSLWAGLQSIWSRRSLRLRFCFSCEPRRVTVDTLLCIVSHSSPPCLLSGHGEEGKEERRRRRNRSYGTSSGAARLVSTPLDSVRPLSVP